jgi:hypothetical protein
MMDRVIWVWHVHYNGEKRKAYRVVVSKYKGKRPRAKPGADDMAVMK